LATSRIEPIISSALIGFVMTSLAPFFKSSLSYSVVLPPGGGYDITTTKQRNSSIFASSKPPRRGSFSSARRTSGLYACAAPIASSPFGTAATTSIRPSALATISLTIRLRTSSFASATTTLTTGLSFFSVTKISFHPQVSCSLVLWSYPCLLCLFVQ